MKKTFQLKYSEDSDSYQYNDEDMLCRSGVEQVYSHAADNVKIELSDKKFAKSSKFIFTRTKEDQTDYYYWQQSEQYNKRLNRTLMTAAGEIIFSSFGEQEKQIELYVRIQNTVRKPTKKVRKPAKRNRAAAR